MNIHIHACMYAIGLCENDTLLFDSYANNNIKKKLPNAFSSYFLIQFKKKKETKVFQTTKK